MAAKKGSAPHAWLMMGCGALFLAGGIGLVALAGMWVLNSSGGEPAPAAPDAPTEEAPAESPGQAADRAGDATEPAVGRDAPPPPSPESPGSPLTDEGGFSFPGPDGETISAGGLEPSDLPEWLPVERDAITSVRGLRHPQGMTGTIQATSGLEPGVWVERLRESLEQEGLTFRSFDAGGETGGTVIVATSVDRARSFSAEVSPAEGGSAIAAQFSDGFD
ncbi:hypothetical protein ABI59_11975 [Acidobacteria bacterium Mor1]|nr:hypothetical protein ABI59_11975 [Acidobacteria bacterium Mor1]